MEALQFGSLGVSLFDSVPPYEMGCFDSLPLDSSSDIPGPAAQSLPSAFINEDIPMDNFEDFVDNNNPFMPDRWLVPVDDNVAIERPGTPADEEITNSYQKMAPFCDDVQPWHLYDPKTPLHYTVNRVKGFTKEVATQSSAPFLHRYLYQRNTPQCILSCFTACVLYENRTPANTAMIIKSLHGNIRELIDFEADRITATPTEKLARAQALFLYQIIRLFDENITLRSQAERDMPILETWLSELCKIRENLGDLGDDARNQKPVEWERWIFAESLRRTIVMAYSVIVLYSMMKTPDDENGFIRIAIDMETNSLTKRPLGKDGPMVSRIGFVEYLQQGDSEVIIGKWLALNPEKRKDVFIATKFGGVRLPDGFGFRGDAEYVPIACEQSLERLGVETIDLWYPHRLDGSTPVEHIVAEMVKLKEKGKIRHIGLSEVSSATLRRAHAVHPIACVQMEYSAFSTEIESLEHQLIATCRELGVAVVAYSPLSRGLLGGGVQGPDDFEEGDIRRFYPRYSRENFPKNMELVKAFQEVATAKGVTVGQTALAWLLAQGDDIFPIPGTITPKYLKENFDAVHVHLNPEETQRLRHLVDKASVFGERYPAEHGGGLFAETPLPEEWDGEKRDVVVIGRVIPPKQ
ncbi:hypothetical protein SLS64_005800 [Diaporthe eres]